MRLFRADRRLAPALETERLRPARVQRKTISPAHHRDPVRPGRHGPFRRPALGREECVAPAARRRRLVAVARDFGYLGRRAEVGRQAGRATSACSITSAKSTPSIEGKPELGYIFAAEVHGQGVAREACDALARMGRRTLEADADARRSSRLGQRAVDQARRKLGFERAARRRSIATSRSRPLAPPRLAIDG